MKIIISAFLLLSLPFNSFGAGKKHHMVAEGANLNCIEKASRYKAITENAGVVLDGANKAEKKMVGNLINTIENLTNQAQAEKLLHGLTIRFKNVLGSHSSGGCLPAHQLVRNEIHIGRKCADGMEIPFRDGILIHEIGHFVANKHGLYPQHAKKVRKKCKLTQYMSSTRTGKKHRNRNEEFAEVFAAYLILGKDLKRKCKGSYEFLKEELFLGSHSNCL